MRICRNSSCVFCLTNIFIFVANEIICELIDEVLSIFKLVINLEFILKKWVVGRDIIVGYYIIIAKLKVAEGMKQSVKS